MSNSQNAVAHLIKKLSADKCQLYTQLNSGAVKGQIVLVGDSLIENFMIQELFHGNQVIYNRGIAGNTTYDIMERLDTTVTPLQPKKVFLLAGTNDFMPHIKANDDFSIAGRIIEICASIRAAVYDCDIYVLSLTPANFSDDPCIYKDWLLGKTNERISNVNQELHRLCIQYGYTFVNIHSALLDENGQLKIELTLDGTHINIKAYKIILEQLKVYFTM